MGLLTPTDVLLGSLRTHSLIWAAYNAYNLLWFAPLLLKQEMTYRIALYFWGTKFSRIGLAHNFAEIIFADRSWIAVSHAHILVPRRRRSTYTVAATPCSAARFPISAFWTLCTSLYLSVPRLAGPEAAASPLRLQTWLTSTVPASQVDPEGRVASCQRSSWSSRTEP